MSVHKGDVDAVRTILKLAYLNGSISTKGLIERSLLRGEPVETVPESHAQRLIKRLRQTLLEQQLQAEAMGSLTLGEFILRKLSGEETPVTGGLNMLAALIQEPPGRLRKLCNDRLSPTAITPEHMAHLLAMFGLSKSVARVLLLNAYRCAMLCPSMLAALTRYSPVKRRGHREAVRRAIRELHLKSDSPLTGNQHDHIESYIRAATDLLSA